jgi:hypothetical protein
MRSRANGRDPAAVRQVLQHYASRGTFRSFAEGSPRGRSITFRFNWFRDMPFTVSFSPGSRRLVFQDLLPGVAPRSAMDRDLRRFLRERHSRQLPEHRRVDARKVEVEAANRAGAISLIWTVKGDNADYAVRKAVNVVHEIFTDFLSGGHYAQYQIDHLRLNPEMA